MQSLGKAVARRPDTPVIVTTRHAEIPYDWATEARVDRKGNLRVYQGFSQRAFHPAGEWTRYVVMAPRPRMRSVTMERGTLERGLG